MLGCGNWGQNLVRNYSQLGALAAVHDPDAIVAGAISAQFHVPAVTLEDILADASIDGIVVAAPAERHAALADRSLRAGKHVFVEKPLALNVPQAEDLCRLAAELGRVLMVGHLLQYHPAFQKLLALCRNGTIGRLQYVYSNRLNFGRIRTEENILWSFAPHDISMILALLGDQVETVTAIGHNHFHRNLADVTTTHLTFSSGPAAHIHVSWLHPFKEQRLVVIGDAGMLVFDDQQDWEQKLKIYPHRVTLKDGIPYPKKGDVRAIPVDAAEPLALECQHFLDTISAGGVALTDGAEGLAVLRVLDAAQRAMETRRPVVMAATPYFAHETAEIDAPAEIGEGTRIWHFSHVLKNSVIGQNCNIGQNVVIGPDVRIGNRCKIQNNVSVYPGVTLEDGVFCGPSMVFTNVHNPRAEIERKSEYRPTLVKRGATIGANATVVCGHEIGRYAFVGAGAVVTHDVPDHAVVAGNPARVIGHVCACGVRLPDGDWADAVCSACGDGYARRDGVLVRTSAKEA
ncbi:Gfo/Idh/MocA family oxidoreductase [Paramagnetospirillum kuznetsovii]|uniref:Gfo/Idh/MocA family oxidoreductase n=1 Tax=Paramagnetospirillum kuznetsovii TaxID=2053833 RepID=UPI0023D96581|nr:Gfo/Idh/MocA family oxidoreductase [Paramagnetospirillum kuznetsovii]